MVTMILFTGSPFGSTAFVPLYRVSVVSALDDLTIVSPVTSPSLPIVKSVIVPSLLSFAITELPELLELLDDSRSLKSANVVSYCGATPLIEKPSPVYVSVPET